MMPNDSFQPVQLKGEVMDLEFTIDTDHRKRRRNRTTQSCLNCHTSKRKCDRKRPCQRCIQLGLTGLCVYEIDDPALRDDPSVDEITRLRNRIAELESLVRELRGKPHPRWADSNFRDGDPNEKWHSRATKCASGKRSPDSSNRVTRTILGNHLISPIKTELGNHPMSPIKTEPIPETSPSLYRFSTSPGLASGSMRYHLSYPGELGESSGSPTSPYEVQRNFSSTQAYGSHPTATYHTHSISGASSYSTDTNGSYGSNHGYGSATPNDQYQSSPRQSVYCPCRTNPATGVVYLALSQQLQNSLPPLRQYSHHVQCQLFRKVIELNDMVHNGIELNESTSTGHGTAAGQQSQPYDSNTPSDNELLTPLSASSGHTSFHTGTGSPGVTSQEWNNLATAGYSPYFSLPANGDHHNVYTHVIP